MKKLVLLSFVCGIVLMSSFTFLSMGKKTVYIFTTTTANNSTSQVIITDIHSCQTKEDGTFFSKEIGVSNDLDERIKKDFPNNWNIFGNENTKVWVSNTQSAAKELRDEYIKKYENSNYKIHYLRYFSSCGD